MNIQHVHATLEGSRKPAWSFVADITNTFTEHTAYAENEYARADTDVFHLHRAPPPWMTREHLSRTMLFFHGLAWMDISQAMLRYVDVVGRRNCFIPAAQQHAFCFAEYAGFGMLRNPILLDEIPEHEPTSGRLRIAIPCSTLKGRGKPFAYKGHEETIAALTGLPVDLDAFVQRERAEYLSSISDAHIVISSLATLSFDRIMLEAASRGRLVLGSMNAEAQRLFALATGTGDLPWELTDLKHVRSRVMQWLDAGFPRVRQFGAQAREWIRHYWHPRDIAEEYIAAYRWILGDGGPGEQ